MPSPADPSPAATPDSNARASRPSLLARLARPLLTGVLALLPLFATVVLLLWTLHFIGQWFGPSSLIGGLITWLGGGGAGSPVLGYLLGLALVLGFVYGFGLLVQTGLQRGLRRIVDALLSRIPVVRTVYDVANRLVDLLGKPKGNDSMKSMRAVWLHFGGPPGSEDTHASATVVLGLLTTAEPVDMGGHPYHGVLVPTAPVPVGGGLLYVPAHWVVPADMGIEAVTSLYVSMGVTSGQHLKRYEKSSLL